MTPSILSRIPILRNFVDERFLDHRCRSSSAAVILCAMLAVCLFEYRYFVDHFWSWDLFALALIFVAVKMSLYVWYRFNA